MAFAWTSIIGLGKRKPHSDRNDQEPRSLQDGLWQIGTQACHILVHANNNNNSSYEDGEDKGSEGITSLVEVATTSDRKSRQDQQLVMLIPHTSSRLAPAKGSKRFRLNVSCLLLLLLLYPLIFDYCCMY
jgi:hypothetical protein